MASFEPCLKENIHFETFNYTIGLYDLRPTKNDYLTW